MRGLGRLEAWGSVGGGRRRVHRLGFIIDGAREPANLSHLAVILSYDAASVISYPRSYTQA